MNRDTIKNWPVGERPRERLIAEGAAKLTDAELLAILLRVGRGSFKKGIPGESASALAKRLLADFNGLRGLDRAHIEELLSQQGLSTAKVAQLKAAFEVGRRVQTARLTAPSFDSSKQIALYFRPRFANARHEIVFAIFLNGQNQPLAEREIARGTPTQATVYVRAVMEEALRVSAAGFVIVHNHPSGSSAPSSGDDATTRDLFRAATIMNLVMLDHIIVGADTHFSYADSGQLKTLCESEEIP
jgi:DNA repair protein RadC